MKEAKRLNIQWLMLLAALCALTGAFALFGGNVQAAEPTVIDVGKETYDQPYNIYINGNEWGLLYDGTGQPPAKQGDISSEGVVLLSVC